jgi:hypothetical protein
VLRFFRLNDPYRLLGVLFVMTLIALPLLIRPQGITIPELKDMVLGEALNDGKAMYLQVIDDTPWLTSRFAKWMDWVFGRSLTGRHIIALIALFFQAAFFSFILIRNKAYNENNYFPALIFGALSFFSFDMLSLSDELWASTFLLFALNNLFKEIEFRVQRDETILNLGIYLGISSMFVFRYSIFLIGSLAILLAFARIDLRKSLMLFFGFLFPHLLLSLLYFFEGGLQQLWELYYSANFTLQSVNLISWGSLFWLGAGPIIYFLFSMVMLGREARFTRYQSQLLQVMLIWLIVAAISVMISRELTPNCLIVFLPSLAYFISHYILLIRRKWIAEAMLWLLLISIVGINMTSQMNRFKRVDYSRMFVKGDSSIVNKRILILSNNVEMYKNNKMASYFLNWDLSKEVFELNHYYEDLALISDSFRDDPPDIIVDEQNRMKTVFSRLPALTNQYVRKGIYYERIK